MFSLSDYNYDLPEDLIAQVPAKPADSSKLLVYSKMSDTIDDAHFSDLPELLGPSDVLFFNNTKVLPARIPLRNVKVVTRLGREVMLEEGELFFLEEKGEYRFEGLMSLLKRNRPGMKIYIDDIVCELIDLTEKGGIFELTGSDVMSFLMRYGQMPLPPYIAYSKEEAKHYQTSFAEHPGSVAAPTASLHFTPKLLKHLRDNNIDYNFVTLHVGLGTFKPVDTTDIRDYHIHDETMVIDMSLFEIISILKQSGKNITAVGTTVSRVLETLPYVWKLFSTQGNIHKNRHIKKNISHSELVEESWAKPIAEGAKRSSASLHSEGQLISPTSQSYRNALIKDITLEQAEKYILDIQIIDSSIIIKTRIFIYPGFQRRIVDSLITNFHLPQSTLLMLVASFIGYENMKKIYAYAIENTYRFYSFGDGMLLRK